MDQKLIINVLGPLEVLVQGKHVFIRNRRLRTLLTVLALSPGEPVPLSDLIDAIWPSAAPSTAMHQVRKTLSGLREILPDGWENIRTTDTGYAILLGPPQSDFAAFRALVTRAQSEAPRGHERADTMTSALRLWRGLPGQGDLHTASRFVTEAVRQWRAALGDAVSTLRSLDRKAEAVQLTEKYTAVMGNDETAPDLRRQLLSAADDGGPQPAAAAGGAGGNALPPRDLLFSGRSAELEMLVRYLRIKEHSASPTVLIHGPVGVGKSALATEVAYRVLPRYPTGVFYLNAENMTDKTLADVAAATQLLLQVEGMWRDLPADPSVRIALWRGLIASQSSLLLIDNYAGDFDLRQILPNGARCASIITSRHTVLGINLGTSCRLGVMRDDEGSALAERVLGEAPIREIVATSHGMPSVIRGRCDAIREVALSGSREAGNPMIRVAASITPSGGYRLRDKIDSAIQSLDNDSRMFLSVLALAPAPEYTYELMLTLFSEPPDNTDKIIARLVHESFLQISEQGTFVLPQVLYEYLRDKRDGPATLVCEAISEQLACRERGLQHALLDTYDRGHRPVGTVELGEHVGNVPFGAVF